MTLHCHYCKVPKFWPKSWLFFHFSSIMPKFVSKRLDLLGNFSFWKPNGRVWSHNPLYNIKMNIFWIKCFLFEGIVWHCKFFLVSERIFIRQSHVLLNSWKEKWHLKRLEKFCLKMYAMRSTFLNQPKVKLDVL